MSQHILLMNVVALAAAALAARHLPAWLGGAPVAAAVVQLALLWGWHAPPVLTVALEFWPVHALMQASLLLSALWFWHSVLTVSQSRQWLPVLILLFTSKLFCLLGVLLIFAGRELYPIAGLHHHGGAAVSGLEDQQLAGLLMIVACPLSYLSVGVFLTARWMGLIERRAHHG